MILLCKTFPERAISCYSEVQLPKEAERGAGEGAGGEMREVLPCHHWRGRKRDSEGLGTWWKEVSNISAAASTHSGCAN